MQINKEIIQFCQKEVDNLLTRIDGVEMLNIASVDGFDLLSYNNDSKENTQNFSAMSSSIMALINSLLTECSFPSSDFLEINVEDGHIILAPVKISTIDMIILLKLNGKSTKGEILYYFKDFLNILRNKSFL